MYIAFFYKAKRAQLHKDLFFLRKWSRTKSTSYISVVRYHGFESKSSFVDMWRRWTVVLNRHPVMLTIKRFQDVAATVDLGNVQHICLRQVQIWQNRQKMLLQNQFT